MQNPQEEAINILKQVLSSIFNKDSDVKTLLRQCAHACQILSWGEQHNWFMNELNGYPSGTPLPRYRKDVQGRTEWLTVGGIYTTFASVVQNGFSTKEEQYEVTTLDVWAGIDWILSAAQTGYTEPTGKKSSKYIATRKENVETKQIRHFDKSVFLVILGAIENSIFDFASRAHSVLLYGDALQDIWQSYRAVVDSKLEALGFKGHLDTIRNGLNSSNAQDWRTAMWSCRDILHDLATYLWQDSRETYECLPGKDGKLEVTPDKYVNRLGAYLHQKGVTGDTRAYITAEMERIYHSIKTLNELDSSAHNAVSLPDVRTAAIGTYTILGELVTRTDMSPILKYDYSQSASTS
jgi:hypothetical protein